MKHNCLILFCMCCVLEVSEAFGDLCSYSHAQNHPLKMSKSQKIIGTGDKSRRIELPRGETMEENLPFRRKCEQLGVSPSTVYSRRQMRIGRRNEEDIELARKIEDIYLRWP